MTSLANKVAEAMQGFTDLCSQNTSPALPLQAQEPVAVAWTGGKDSTVALHLWKTFLEQQNLLQRFHLVAVNIDTGLKFPEVMALRDKLAEAWGIRLYVAKPLVPLKGYPVAEEPAVCCKELKIDPLLRCLEEHGLESLLTGLRRDEHPSRERRQWLEPRDTPPHLQCNPILEWSEMDVWAYIMEHNIPYCELYAAGYRSLGCIPCTTLPQTSATQERAGRNQAKEEQLELLRSMGYF